MQSLTFSNGLTIPTLGLGTWTSPPDKIKEAVNAALEAGYRHIDGAFLYENEKEIGEALEEAMKRLNIAREDIFITSKPGEEKYPRAADGTNLAVEKVPLLDTWKAMEQLHDDGKVKSLGLSNCNRRQTYYILQNSRVKPVNLQVEIHANFPNVQLAEFAQSVGLTVSAYSPLGSPAALPGRTNLLTESWVSEIAKKHNKTTGQILLRYLLQRNLIVLPKSITPSRIVENSQIYDFVLSNADMKVMATKGLNERQFKLKMYSVSEGEFNVTSIEQQHDPYIRVKFVYSVDTYIASDVLNNIFSPSYQRMVKIFLSSRGV